MSQPTSLNSAKIEEIQRDRKEAHAFFFEKSEVYRVFVGMEMGIGPTTVTSRFAMKVLKHHLGEGI